MLYSAFPIRKTAVLLLAPLKDSFMHELPPATKCFFNWKYIKLCEWDEPKFKINFDFNCILYILK